MIEREAFQEDALSVCQAEVILFMSILVLFIILFVYKVGKY